MNIRCFLFGHAGSHTDSGYHVCDRCGAHAYWSWRVNNPDCGIEYGNAGHLVNWYWRWRDARERRRWEDDNDLPF